MPASLTVRRSVCDRVVAKYPNQCPLVLLSGKTKKGNFLSLSPTATVADIEKAVRDVATFGRGAVSLSVAGCTPSSSTTIGDLYAACKDEDGFLYVTYTGERRLGDANAFPCLAVAGNVGGDDYDKMMQDATADLKSQFVQSAHDVVTERADQALGQATNGGLAGLTS